MSYWMANSGKIRPFAKSLMTNSSIYTDSDDEALALG